MHVAFGRVRRKSRIFSDSADFLGLWGFGLLSLLVRRARLGTLTVSECKLESTKASGIGVPSYRRDSPESSESVGFHCVCGEYGYTGKIRCFYDIYGFGGIRSTRPTM